MDLVIKLVIVAMVLAGISYLIIGLKEKHKGLFIAGIIWWLGAYLTYQLDSLWLLPVAFIVALLLNMNPKHK